MNHETELAELDLEQRRLEIDKLRAEVDQARLAWWKRPGYLGGMTPIVLALVGLVTAWANGYFDTQRTQLANEIGVLQGEKDALLDDIKAVQFEIDISYLWIKLATEEAIYTVAHFQAVSDESQETVALVKSLKTLLDKLPPIIRTQIPSELPSGMDRFVSLSDQRGDLETYAREALDELKGHLGKIKASDWAVALDASNPMARQARVMLGADGAVFGMEKGQFLTDEEIAELQAPGISN